MKKSLKLLLVLLSALFAVTTVTSCSIGDTLNTLGEVADLAAEVLDEIEDASTSVETGETNELPSENTEAPQPSESPSDEKIDENGSYTTKEDVALYLYAYGKLPKNFITKDEARALGWEGGGLNDAMGVFGVVPLAFAVWVGAKFFTYAWADGGRKKKGSGTASDREKEEKLKQLDTLQKAGLYTEEEYKAAKSAILEERFK